MTPFENELDQLLTQAEALLQDQKPVEALALLERAQTLEPHHAWTMLFRGVALGQLGRTEEAVPQLIGAADSQLEDIDIQVDAARHLALLEYPQDALICAGRAVEIDANDAGAHAVRAEVLERLGRISEALSSRETALTLDSEDTDSRYYLAVDFCDVGRYDEAYQTAQPLFDQFPDDPDIIRLHGACLSYLDRHQDALIKWAELERLEGVNPNLLHNRASTLDALGRRDEALATISEAIEAEPDMAMNHYTRGMIHEHAGDDAAAIDDYLAALALDPGHTDAAINLVELTTAMNATLPVLERVNKLLEEHPTSAQLLYVAARLTMDLGDLPQARRLLEDAILREPGLGISWYTLTMLYSMTGDAEAVLASADRALRDFPEDAALWLTRGQAMQDLRRYPEAMECYDRAATLVPDDDMPWFYLGRLLLLELDRPAAARGALREAVRLHPENDAAMWMLALCYLRTGQSADGSRLIQQLLNGDPNHLWGHLLRAAWYVQQGQLNEALDDLAYAGSQGYDLRLLLNEPLFEPLWSDPRFRAAFPA